jgi:polar amino acid transport system ATP-binding protein
MMMIVATHEMSFAREVADEVCFPRDGAIVERGSGERMFTAPEQPETPRFLRRLLDAHRM